MAARQTVHVALSPWAAGVVRGLLAHEYANNPSEEREETLFLALLDDLDAQLAQTEDATPVASSTPDAKRIAERMASAARTTAEEANA